MTSNARISLAENDELDPAPATAGWTPTEVSTDILENIVTEFNTRFGTNFTNEDSIKKMIENISDEIVWDNRMVDSLQTDRANRKLEFKKLLEEKITINVDDHLEFYNNYYDNSDFQDHLIRCLDKVVEWKLKEKI